MTANDAVALIVGPSAQEFAEVRQCLSDWKCVNVPASDGGPAVSSIIATPQLIIVYAPKDEKKTLAICEQLRNAPETADAPLLLVISRYLISQAHAIKRMGNAGFIITPFDEKQMCEKIAELVDS